MYSICSNISFNARGARGLSFGLSLHLYPYFAYARREGTGGTAHMFANAINAKILCAGHFIFKTSMDEFILIAYKV